MLWVRWSDGLLSGRAANSEAKQEETELLGSNFKDRFTGLVAVGALRMIEKICLEVRQQKAKQVPQWLACIPQPRQTYVCI